MGQSDDFDLFSNLDLEEGLGALCLLQWDEAVELLEQALKKASDVSQAQFGLNAIEYWRPRLRDIALTEEEIKQLVDDVKAFSYTDLPSNFRNETLIFIANKSRDNSSIGPDIVVSIFDLLLDAGMLDKAEEFIGYYLMTAPDSTLFIICLAQVQWLNHNNAQANLNYIKAVLSDPQSIQIDRIANNEVRQLIIENGIILSPAMMRLDKLITGFEGINDMLQSDRGGEALECLKLLYLAEKCEQEEDMSNALLHRKKMKERYPVVFQKYFTILNARKKRK
ncbi:MAG: hypothetical protein IT216_00605 [Saprospiraceae bacterium]|nr:hypothetical protein [Saprospiraceae bacterium]